MNSMQRCRATVEGAPTDRRFAALTLSLYGARLTGRPLREHYTDPQAYVEGQIAVREIFQPDLLLSPFAFAMEAEAFGAEVRYHQKQPPAVCSPAIASAEQIAGLSAPDVDGDPRLGYVREAVRSLAGRYAEEVPIAATVVGPLDLPALILGIDTWLETLLFDKEAVSRMLDVSTCFFVRWANALLADGATMIVSSAVFSNPGVITRKILDESGIPALRQAFGRIDGPLLLHHGGAMLGPFLQPLAGLPNVIGFGLDHRDDPADARRRA